MSKNYIIYIILAVLYIVLLIIDMANIYHIDQLYLHIGYVLTWGVLLLSALNQLFTGKKTYRNYVLVAINLLILCILIYRIVTR